MGPIIYTNYLNTATLQNQFFSPYTFTGNTDWTSINHDSILKWRPPKNIQANPPKNQLSVTFYHLNIKEKIKYFKTKSQFTTSKFKTSANCILSHILVTNTSPLSPTWPSVGSFSTQWVFMLGFLMFGKGQMSCSATLMILFTHSDHLSDAYLLYLTFE